MSHEECTELISHDGILDFECARSILVDRIGLEFVGLYCDVLCCFQYQSTFPVFCYIVDE